MIQTFYIFDKILSAQIIFSVQYTLNKESSSGYILNRFKMPKYFWHALKYFHIM